MAGFFINCKRNQYSILKKKTIKYIARPIALLVGIYILILLGVYIYVAMNKTAILQKVTSTINQKIKGTVTIDNIDITLFSSFPSFEVQLKNVSIKDSMYTQHGHSFLQAENIYAKINFFSIIKLRPQVKKLVVENAAIYFFRDSLGYTTEYLLQPKHTDSLQSQTSEKNAIDNIELKQVRFIKDDQQKNKLFDFSIKKLECKTDEEAAETLFHLDNEILVNALSFNLEKGSFITSKIFKGSFDVRFNNKNHQMHFENIPVELDAQAFTFTGKFNFTDTPTFKIDLVTNNILYGFAKTLVTQKIAKGLAVVSIDKPINVTGSIEGPLNGGEPLIQMHWTTKDNILKTPLLDFEHATFSGNFTNQLNSSLPRNDENTRVELHGFSADWNGLIFTAKDIVADNLSTTTVKTAFECNASFEQLNNILGSNALQLLSGKASMALTYNGPLLSNKQNNTFVNGNINISNGEILYGPKNVLLKNCHGSIVFLNSDVYVNKLQTNLLGNDIIMQGSAKNIVNLIDTDPGKVDLSWNIYSPKLNLESLIPIFSNEDKQVKNTSAKKIKPSKIAQEIDNLLAFGNLKITAKTPLFTYQKFKAEQVDAEILLVKNKWFIQKASLQHAGGSMNVSGSLNSELKSQLALVAKVDMSNMDIQKLMYAFNDFGQDAISYKNLKGKFSGAVNVAAMLNNKMQINPSSVNGVFDFSIKNGMLENFEPLYKLQEFVFKKRDFSHVEFAELKDRLVIKDREITINRMEIRSSAISLFVEGLYSMKGNTDLSIQLPLSNLKKKKADYKPENTGVSKGGGASVFIRAKPDKKGEIKFSYDVLGRFRKNKQETKE